MELLEQKTSSIFMALTCVTKMFSKMWVDWRAPPLKQGIRVVATTPTLRKLFTEKLRGSAEGPSGSPGTLQDSSQQGVKEKEGSAHWRPDQAELALPMRLPAGTSPTPRNPSSCLFRP